MRTQNALLWGLIRDNVRFVIPHKYQGILILLPRSRHQLFRDGSDLMHVVNSFAPTRLPKLSTKYFET